jgi:branched-chain amino acid transport system permease protein
MAGVVLVINQAAFRSVTYGPDQSIDVFVATVIGGLGSLAGAVLGAVFQRGAEWLLPAPWSFLATGAGVLVVLLSMPDGLGGVVFRVRDRYLAWAARRNGVASLAIDRTHLEATVPDLAAADGASDDDAAETEVVA